MKMKIKSVLYFIIIAFLMFSNFYLIAALAQENPPLSLAYIVTFIIFRVSLKINYNWTFKKTLIIFSLIIFILLLFFMFYHISICCPNIELKTE